MDQTFSRPIMRLGTAGDGWMLNRSTRVCTISVMPAGGDVTVKFMDGAGGQILWQIEADNAAGSNNCTFPYPLLFKNGVYVMSESSDTNYSIQIAVIEPMSSGT